jgi:hypothetical protein
VQEQAVEVVEPQEVLLLGVTPLPRLAHLGVLVMVPETSSARVVLAVLAVHQPVLALTVQILAVAAVDLAMLERPKSQAMG